MVVVEVEGRRRKGGGTEQEAVGGWRKRGGGGGGGKGEGEEKPEGGDEVELVETDGREESANICLGVLEPS